jgi:hypothetical protein
VESAETAIAKERFCKRHGATNYRGEIGNVTIKEMWEEVFSMLKQLRRSTIKQLKEYP